MDEREIGDRVSASTRRGDGEGGRSARPVDRRDAVRWGEPAAAWWVLAACVVTIVLAAGTRASFAAFLRPIEADLGLDRATLSNVGALTGISYGLAMPLAGWLATRFGPLPVMMASAVLMTIGGLGVAFAEGPFSLFLFAGLVPGVGFGGASLVPATVLLARWFGQRLGLATGIMTAALPGGQALFIPLAVALIPVLGWRNTYIVLGLTLAAVVLPACGWSHDALRCLRRSRVGPGARLGPGSTSG